MDVGIVGYGAYVPRYRIKSEEIAQVWGEDPDRIKNGLKINEKTVPSIDEDASTIAIEAGYNALRRARIDPKKIGAVMVGSESHPYAVKPTASIVAEALGITPNTTAADLEFACKAGTAGIQFAMGMVASGMIEYGLAIGADTAQGKPGDALEYSAAAGGAAYIIGRDKYEIIAKIEHTCSFTTDTPDFWRRQKADFPEHGGRFTGKPAYFKHIIGATEMLLEQTATRIQDYDHVVFHQPNGKFPLAVAKMLGVPLEKMKYSLLTPYIGNTYSGAVPLALANVLDNAQEGDRILVTSFGSGAGSDSFSILVTSNIEKKRNLARPLEHYINNKEYVSYAIYAKNRKKLKGM